MLGFIDGAHRFDPKFFRDQRERAVVRTDKVVAGFGFQRDGFSIAPNARIDHGHEHRSHRPVSRGLLQPVRRLPQVEGRVIVREIVDRDPQTHARCHSAHRTDRTILKTEVRLQHERVFGGAGGKREAHHDSKKRQTATSEGGAA